ncbi:MAG: hypothetical protein JWO88_1040, partial [Frankiales bacterium]|nr:hypothetical protein [Frankiales bacterium]
DSRGRLGSGAAYDVGQAGVVAAGRATGPSAAVAAAEGDVAVGCGVANIGRGGVLDEPAPQPASDSPTMAARKRERRTARR